jgi:hypothetical protein
MLFISGIPGIGQEEKDPHRPPCSSPQCRKIKSYLLAHYCGESPFGNGPDDGCDIRSPKKMSSEIKVMADFDCDESETDGTSKCRQRGRPSEAVQNILVREMRRIGLPESAVKELHYIAWEYNSPRWILAVGNYERTSGTVVKICRMIIVINPAGKVYMLRKVPLQKTDVDVPNVITWLPIDIADVNGDGQMEIILQGNAYEDHWLEVDSINDNLIKTIFSGLGYYL